MMMMMMMATTNFDWSSSHKYSF